MPARKLRWRKDGKRNITEREALWQYILDHARPTEDGGLRVLIGIKNREQFESSLDARIEGRYRFTEEDVFKMKPVYTAPNKTTDITSDK